MAGRPDILWIITTQWRAQACGYAGDANARTPALDRLAARSVNYTQAVTPHPFGPFARAAILTGVPSPENGVCDYFDPMPLESRTVAHDLHARGYATAWFGKWHLWKRDPAAPLVGDAHARIVVPPEARGGFEFWEGFEGGFVLNDPWLHGTRFPEPVQFSGYQSDIVCQRAGAWMLEQCRNRRSSPRGIFAVVSLESPHPPYLAPAAGVAPSDPAGVIPGVNVPRGGDVERRARAELAGYYAHIEATDRAIGRLVETLPPKTIVVFTSVHGDMHGAHGLFRKGWPHEESIRVPFLVSGLKEAHAVRIDAAISLVDLPAMTRAWADGDEWRCAREEAVISMPSVVRLPHQCDRVWNGTRSLKRKRIFNADGSPWLEFDLERDPYELQNLVPERAYRPV